MIEKEWYKEASSLTVSELLKLLKEIGLVRAAKTISFLAWLVLPFWIWMIIMQFVENKFFILILAIPGIVLYVITLIFIIFQSYFWRAHEFKIMKLIEKSAAELFKDPKNEQKVEEFKNKCRAFILPYSHHMPFSLAALAELVKSVWGIVGKVLDLYGSYSLITFFVIFRGGFGDLFGASFSTISQILPAQLIEWPFRNLWISLGILWMLSLFYDPAVSLMRIWGRLPLPKSRAAVLYFISLYDLSSRIGICAVKALHIPTILRERARAVMCDPFIDPLTLPKIVQKTVRNVEGESCDVSRWSEKIETEADVDRIKKLTLKDPSTPFLLKFFAKIGRPKELLGRIKQMQPMAYIGIHHERCVFLGMVVYDPIMRIRRGRFYFDTTYLKKEFLLIYNKEVENQRRIARKLPPQLEELIKSLV